MNLIKEYSTLIKATLPQRDPTKKQLVFYNPVMSSPRSLSILLLNSLPHQKMNLALPLAGSGIRALRFLQELKKTKIKKIFVNDLKPNFPSVFQENLKLNRLENKKNLLSVHNQDASLFLLQQEGFDYIDLDPFGSPNPFLPAALQRISRKGILAVTATDTAALTGTYFRTTQRKYWAVPLYNYLMHEIGLRILLRKVQLCGTQFDKALTPLLAYHKDHYFRIYFQAQKSKKACDQLLKQHQYFLFCPRCLNFKISPYNRASCSCQAPFQFAGPLWVGQLFDPELLKKMKRDAPFPEEQKFLDLLYEESKKDLPGFYDLHQIAKTYKIEPPKKEIIIKRLKASPTHFSPTGLKTEKKIEKVIQLIKEYQRKCQRPPVIQRDSLRISLHAGDLRSPSRDGWHDGQEAPASHPVVKGGL